MSRLAVSWHTLDVVPAFNLKKAADKSADEHSSKEARKSFRKYGQTHNRHK